MVSWIGIAFVGIGIVSWLFQDAEHGSGARANQHISLKPTGILFILFSLIWLYPGILAVFHQDQKQLEGSAILFLIFLVIGIIAIRLSDRRTARRPRDDENLRE
jgi:hypothetical protein